MTANKQYLLTKEYQNRQRKAAERERLAQLARRSTESNPTRLLSRLGTQLVQLGEHLAQESELPEMRRTLEPQT